MKKREIQKRTEMDMTPMIDVVFLLIIFFMVVTSFSNQIVSAGIILPVADKAVPDEGELRMTVNIDEEGNYVVNGIRFQAETLEHRIRAYGETYRDSDTGLSNGKILIYADKGAPYKYIQNVCSMSQDSRIFRLSFAAEKK